jgi:CHRD domain
MTINMTMGQKLVIIVAFIVAAAAVVLQTTTSTFFTSAFRQQQKFIAELKSEMVVPPVTSNATGTAYFQLDMEDNNKINYSLIATDIHGVKAAHIHSGKEGEKNGPIVVRLYKPFRPPVLFGRILSVHDNIRSDILEGPLLGKQLSDLVNVMNNGTTYVDIHSQEYPNGEIRGQISNRTSIGSSILYF